MAKPTNAEMTTGADMITTGTGGALARPRLSEPPSGGGGWGVRGSRAWWWALGASAGLLTLAYMPNLLDLSVTWSHDDNYQHGFLVIPIALFILWRRLVDLPMEDSAAPATSPWWGWGILAAALLVRAVAYERLNTWIENATFLPAVFGLAWAFGGRPLLHRIWPAIAFLVFMLPLPRSMNTAIGLPLQRIAASGSYSLLQLAGFWVVQEGNILYLTTPFGIRPLDVALACSGLKMLMTLTATVTATIMLLPLPNWKRIVLLLSAVPIALVSNIARIFATACCSYYLEGDGSRHWAHDITGWMMMPMALILVFLALQLLAWLAPPPTEADIEDNRVIFPLLEGKGASAEMDV